MISPAPLPQLTVARLPGGWWIVGDEYGPMGPYERKADAEADRAGLIRYARHEHKPGYVTSEPKPQR